MTDPTDVLAQLPAPYLLFLGDVAVPAFAKTAFGLRDWAPERCVAEWSSPGCTLSLGLPWAKPSEAHRMGARSLVIGVAAPGGMIVPSWIPQLVEAMEAGLDLVSGLHPRLQDTPALHAAAQRTGRRLIDVRRPPPDIPVATGRRRTGKRLLTVGTDCALGKKYAALALARAFAARGLAADFRATGQTGILIAGAGLPIDATVSDFASGAAEMLSPDNDPGHWDIIEGQGSLFHPAYAGVSLALLHGSQPDVIVVCHEPTRLSVLGYPDFALPSLEEAIGLHLMLGARTNPAIRCAGISLNTSMLSDEDAGRVVAETAEGSGLPAADPVRGGAAFDRLVESCLSGG